MEFTLQKTITFILFILIGVLLKLKFKSKEELNGIKKIILNLALPATIFIALLGIEIDTSLLVLPILALALNFSLFLGLPYILPLLGLKKDTPDYRTAHLLVASLAPGLSCFPFVLEFLGEAYLAKVAMADLGNKIFVLIILYIIAMNWHYSHQRTRTSVHKSSKLKSLLWAMVSEPVNLFIVLALILVSLGFSMESLPIFIGELLNRLSIIMTPLVLLFIGLAVKIKKKHLTKLISLLFLRAGFAVLICGMFITISGTMIQGEILVMLAFGLSACSFWPFAHISVVEVQEKELPQQKRTFNTTFAINILALSFPISTLLILGILSSGSIFSSALPVFSLSAALLFLGFIPLIIKRVQLLRLNASIEKEKWLKYKLSAKENLSRPTKGALQ